VLIAEQNQQREIGDRAMFLTGGRPSHRRTPVSVPWRPLGATLRVRRRQPEPVRIALFDGSENQDLAFDRHRWQVVRIV
jgi:hypothetical protein